MFLNGLSMLLTIAKSLTPRSTPMLSFDNLGLISSTSTPTATNQFSPSNDILGSTYLVPSP